MERFVIDAWTARAVDASEQAPSPHGAWEVTRVDGRRVAQVWLVRDRMGEVSELRWEKTREAGGADEEAAIVRGFVERFFTLGAGERLVASVAPDDVRAGAAARAAGLVFVGRASGDARLRHALDRSGWERRSARRAWSVAIFARHDGRVLLVKHKRLGTWLPVGGEVEAGETPLEAARRELFEETGLEGVFPRSDSLEGAPAGLLGYEEHLAGKKGLHLNLSFVADVETRDVFLDDSLAGHVWASLDEGPWSEAPANVRQLAARALAAPSSRP